MKMNKATTKDGLPKQKRRYNTQVIKAIAANRGINEDFVRQCIRGDRNSENAEEIKSEYEKKTFELANTLFSDRP